jgi:4-amino-4-deoxy-L-arabinose transferase-like glycosyltransferase
MDQSLDKERQVVTADFVTIDPRRLFSMLLTFAQSHTAELIGGALLAIMGLQMFVVIWRKSITVDEIVMIPSAYYHLVDSDFQLVNEHPPLSKILAAIPLLFIQPVESPNDPTMSVTSEDKFARQGPFWANNGNRFASIGFWARVPMVLLTLVTGVLVFIFTRWLFGSRAAVLAVGLFSLEPTFLGHGRVVQTDAPAAFGYLLFFVALYVYWRKQTWRTACYLGVAAALAILAKYSMLLTGLVLAPAFLILWWRSSNRRAIVGHAVITLTAIILVINAAYFFKHQGLDATEPAWIAANFPGNGQAVTLVVDALTYLLPKEFLLGICFQIIHNRQGHSASLLGMYSQTGWWYYFPVAMGLKLTLPFLFLSIASTFWSVKRIIANREFKFLWVLIPAALYLIFVLFSHINIGVRYMLPMFPFMIILSAWLLDRLLEIRTPRVASAVALILIGWVLVEAVRAYPNHISYMNQIASRKPHWWYLSDSNVEWGDDLRALAQYLQQKGERRVQDATLGGFGILQFYGIECSDGLSIDPPDASSPRYLAIGASFLNGSTIPSGPAGSKRDDFMSRVNFFEEYRNRVPEAIIGDSIYVFRVR